MFDLKPIPHQLHLIGDIKIIFIGYLYLPRITKYLYVVRVKANNRHILIFCGAGGRPNDPGEDKSNIYFHVKHFPILQMETSLAIKTVIVGHGGFFFFFFFS